MPVRSNATISNRPLASGDIPEEEDLYDAARVFSRPPNTGGKDDVRPLRLCGSTDELIFTQYGLLLLLLLRRWLTDFHAHIWFIDVMDHRGTCQETSKSCNKNYAVLDS